MSQQTPLMHSASGVQHSSFRRSRRPVVLIIRDGWGANPHPRWNHANAVYLARTPVDDRLMTTYPHVLIKTSGTAVGLPDGVMGNSEVGHQNIGAGRVIEQEIMRITNRIRDGSFFSNPALVEAVERARRTGGAVHVLGLCSDGRVHADLDHLDGVLALVCGRDFPGERVFVHAITDGRDTPPHRGAAFLERVEAKCRELGINPIASVVGRYYAMDRDHRWDRTEKAYRLLVHGEGERFGSAVEAARHYYDHPTEPSRQGDEFIVPSVTCAGAADVGSRAGESNCPGRIRDGDSVIFFNFRGDRPRQIVRAFIEDAIPGTDESRSVRSIGFDRGPKLDLHFVTLTRYEQDLPVHVAFDKPPKMEDILGSYLARLGLRQFRCAETEKYPHVTFFFNDYRDDPFPQEERQLIPSPRNITTYDQKPAMSAFEVTEAMLRRLETRRDDVVILNYANGDMVGHTGILEAAIKAVEAVDVCVGRVVEAVVAQGGSLIVTADHGNCEQMIDPQTGGPHTAHTTYDVELIVVDDRFRGASLRRGGFLCDIAPTMLHLLGLPQPAAMTGRSLMEDAR